MKMIKFRNFHKYIKQVITSLFIYSFRTCYNTKSIKRLKNMLSFTRLAYFKHDINIY